MADGWLQRDVLTALAQHLGVVPLATLCRSCRACAEWGADPVLWGAQLRAPHQLRAAWAAQGAEAAARVAVVTRWPAADSQVCRLLVTGSLACLRVPPPGEPRAPIWRWVHLAAGGEDSRAKVLELHRRLARNLWALRDEFDRYYWLIRACCRGYAAGAAEPDRRLAAAPDEIGLRIHAPKVALAARAVEVGEAVLPWLLRLEYCALWCVSHGELGEVAALGERHYGLDPQAAASELRRIARRVRFVEGNVARALQMLAGPG
jgi:hypothetical protein